MSTGINVIDYSVLTVGTTTKDLSSTACSPVLPGKANRMFVTSETAAVRWRADGTSPTGTEGHTLAKDDSISFTGANYRQLLEKIEFITDGTSAAASLKITWFD